MTRTRVRLPPPPPLFYGGAMVSTRQTNHRGESAMLKPLGLGSPDRRSKRQYLPMTRYTLRLLEPDGVFGSVLPYYPKDRH